MNTLTQEQKKKVLEEYVGDDRAKLLLNGFSFEIESSEMLDLLKAVFALGVAQKREECAKICDLLGGDIDPNKPDETKLAANSLAHAIRKSE